MCLSVDCDAGTQRITISYLTAKNNVVMTLTVPIVLHQMRILTIKTQSSNLTAKCAILKFTTKVKICHSLLLIFPFLDGDVPLAPSNGVYISQLVRYFKCKLEETKLYTFFHKLKKIFFRSIKYYFNFL